MRIEAGADGSALGNPGPTGWAWYVDEDRWRSGGLAHGTNNIGELTAVLDLLEQTAADQTALHIFCDSTYVINTITKWIPGWKRKGWRKSDGKPVQNLEIVKALDAAMAGRDVTFEWVKGHTGHPLNEPADRLANAAAQAHKEGQEVETGPGFFPGVAAEPRKLGPSDVDLVISAEQRLLSPEAWQAPGGIAALLHPEWCQIGISGRLWTRAEVLASPGPKSGSVAVEVVSTQRLGADLILLITRRVAQDVSMWSSTWQRDQEGTWLARFHQGTPQPDLPQR